jgi:hypothetical protein
MSVDRDVQLRIWKTDIRKRTSIYWSGREATKDITQPRIPWKKCR